MVYATTILDKSIGSLAASTGGAAAKVTSEADELKYDLRDIYIYISYLSRQPLKIKLFR